MLDIARKLHSIRKDRRARAATIELFNPRPGWDDTIFFGTPTVLFAKFSRKDYQARWLY